MYKNNTSAVIVKGARFMPCTLTDENSGKTYEINVKEPKLKVYYSMCGETKEVATEKLENIREILKEVIEG